MELCTGAHPHVIHVPQKPTRVLGRALTIFLEIILVPAAILASLGGAGQVTLAIMAVFAWRIVAAGTRLAFVGLLPATSILTFVMLAARTGAGGAFGATDSGSAIVAYVLPGCIVGALAGMYFMASARTDKPVVLKLAQDFVTLSEEAQTRLLSVFKAVTFIIGFLNLAFAAAGGVVVFTAEERQASILTSGLAVAGPLSILVVCVTVGVFMLRRSRLKVTFRPEPILDSTTIAI